jgi:hypothetical protein
VRLALAVVLDLRGLIAPAEDGRIELLELLLADEEVLFLGVEEVADATARELAFLLHMATNNKIILRASNTQLN